MDYPLNRVHTEDWINYRGRLLSRTGKTEFRGHGVVLQKTLFENSLCMGRVYWTFGNSHRQNTLGLQDGSLLNGEAD